MVIITSHLASLVPISCDVWVFLQEDLTKYVPFSFGWLNSRRFFMAVWYDVIHFRIPQAMTDFQVYIYIWWYTPLLMVFCDDMSSFFFGGFLHLEQTPAMETGKCFWYYVWRLIWRLTIMLCYLFVPLTFWTFSKASFHHKSISAGILFHTSRTSSTCIYIYTVNYF